MKKIFITLMILALSVSAWAAGPISFGGGGSGDMAKATYDTNDDSMVDADKINGSIDATKIGAGGVTSTEFGYIGTLSSDIQTQVTARVSKTDAAFTASTELTISGGAITRTQALHTVDTEADAASDNLDTISGGADGNILFIRANHTDRTVVVTESGNIVIPQGTQISLDDNIKTLLLVYDGTLTKWIVVNVLPDSLSISEITLGGIILGDDSPDAAGELGYAAGNFLVYDSALKSLATGYIDLSTGGTTRRVKTVSDAAATIVEYGQAGTGNIATTGTISGGALTPVIDDPDNFAANFTGANFYGGTFIANAAGTAALPDPAVGMNFTYILEGANANIIDPLGTGTADTIYMNGLAAAADENITSSTSGAICTFQYRAANTWMATCNGFAEATPP